MYKKNPRRFWQKKTPRRTHVSPRISLTRCVRCDTIVNFRTKMVVVYFFWITIDDQNACLLLQTLGGLHVRTSNNQSNSFSGNTFQLSASPWYSSRWKEISKGSVSVHNWIWCYPIDVHRVAHLTSFITRLTNNITTLKKDYYYTVTFIFKNTTICYCGKTMYPILVHLNRCENIGSFTITQNVTVKHQQLQLNTK